jgi:hypothetical protein
MVLPLFCSCEESRLLVSWCAVTGATWRAAMRIMVGVRDQMQKTRMVEHRSGTWWPDDRDAR